MIELRVDRCLSLCHAVIEKSSLGAARMDRFQEFVTVVRILAIDTEHIEKQRRIKINRQSVE